MESLARASTSWSMQTTAGEQSSRFVDHTVNPMNECLDLKASVQQCKVNSRQHCSDSVCILVSLHGVRCNPQLSHIRVVVHKAHVSNNRDPTTNLRQTGCLLSGQPWPHARLQSMQSTSKQSIGQLARVQLVMTERDLRKMVPGFHIFAALDDWKCCLCVPVALCTCRHGMQIS